MTDSSGADESTPFLGQVSLFAGDTAPSGWMFCEGQLLLVDDNEFLFNVAEDPLERANLKGRQPEVYDRLVTKWLEWNQTMLPEVDESSTGGITGTVQADHIGAGPATRKADNPGPPPAR